MPDTVLLLPCGCEFTGAELTFLCEEADTLLNKLLAALDALAYARATRADPAPALARLHTARIRYARHFNP